MSDYFCDSYSVYYVYFVYFSQKIYAHIYIYIKIYLQILLDIIKIENIGSF